MGKVCTDATLQGILNVLLEENIYLQSIGQSERFALSDIQTMKDISDAGTARQFFKIGDQIVIDYTDTDGNTYEMPWDIVHIGDATLADGTIKHDAVYLQSHYATVESIQYDHQENEKATEATAQEGVYYYVPNGTDSNGYNVYKLLEIAAGETIDYTANPIVYHSAIKDPSGYIVRHGYNRESHSAIRQWLNSSAVKGQWWTAQHVGDVAPIQLNTVNGFMAGLPEAFTNCMKNLKITRALNTISEPDKNIISESYNAKIFLPSIEQMYIEPQTTAGLEGEAWDYYKQLAIGIGLSGPFQQLQTYHILTSYTMNTQSMAQYVRTSSVSSDYSCYVWTVISRGYVNGVNASGTVTCRPACVI